MRQGCHGRRHAIFYLSKQFLSACFGDGGFVQIFEIVSKVCEHECRVLAALMVVKFGMGWQQAGQSVPGSF